MVARQFHDSILASLAVLVCLVSIACSTMASPAPGKQPEQPREPTDTEVIHAASQLFGKKKPRSVEAVLERLGRLDEYGRRLDLPIEPDVLLKYNEATEANCNDHEYIQTMIDTLSTVKHCHRALVDYIEDCIKRQMGVCKYGQRIIETLDDFDQSDRWTILGYFHHYAKKFGKRISDPVTFEYMLDEDSTKQTMEAVMLKSEKDHKSKGQGGSKDPVYFAAQIKSACNDLFAQQHLWLMSRQDPNAKDDEQVKRLHEYFGICQEAACIVFE